MPRKTIAQSLLNNAETEERKGKKSSAERKRLTIGSSRAVKVKLPKITKIFSRKDENETQEQKDVKIKVAAKKAKDIKETRERNDPSIATGGKNKDFLDDDYANAKRSEERRVGKEC